MVYWMWDKALWCLYGTVGFLVLWQIPLFHAALRLYGGLFWLYWVFNS